MRVIEEAELIARRFLASHHHEGLCIALVTVAHENFGLPGWRIVFDTYTADHQRVDPPVVVRMNELRKEANFLR